MICDIFQTVKDLDNVDRLEQQGPIFCDSNSAWLGHGYYFWDSEIELAHWWGEVHCLNYGYDYLILKSSYDKWSDSLFDLYDNAAHRRDMVTALNIAKERTNKRYITVPYLIEILKKSKNFCYRAIRAKFDNSINAGNLIDYRPFANKNSKSKLDLYPAIQICVLDKSFLESPVKVVYPNEYCDESFTF